MINQRTAFDYRAAAPKTRAVILWGVTDLTQRVGHSCEQIGLEIRGVADHQHAGTGSVCNWPVLTLDEAKALLTRENLGVVVCTIGRYAQDEFVEALNTIRNDWRVDSVVLHPAFLADYARLPFQRVFLNGLPGSGNLISQALVREVLGQAPMHHDEGMQLLVFVVSAYWNTLCSVVLSHFNIFGRGHHIAAISLGMYGQLNCHFRDQPSFLLHGLPQRGYVWNQPISPSHEPLTDAALELYRRQGYRPIELVRHPFDTILSNAAKITVTSGHRNPRFLLQNEDWFRGWATTIRAYFEAVIARRQDLHLLRYEDLLAKPQEQISACGRVLGVDVDPGWADELWQRYGLKPLELAMDPGHLWDPRANKWADFFSRRNLEIARAEGLTELAREFGYETAVELSESDSEPIDDPKIQIDKLAHDEGRYYGSIGKPPAFHHDSIFHEEAANGRLYVVGASSMRDELRRFLNSEFFSNFLDAARLEADPTPRLVKDVVAS